MSANEHSVATAIELPTHPSKRWPCVRARSSVISRFNARVDAGLRAGTPAKGPEPAGTFRHLPVRPGRRPACR